MLLEKLRELVSIEYTLLIILKMVCCVVSTILCDNTFACDSNINGSKNVNLQVVDVLLIL